jgi:adenylate cyclase
LSSRIQAFEVREAVEKYSLLNGFDFKVRIGLHSGPVVAGIIGQETTHFDLWGSTVNMAARLESSGEPGAIQISDKLAERVKEKYELEFKGHKDLKGIGNVKTYFVIKPKLMKKDDQLLKSAS